MAYNDDQKEFPVPSAGGEPEKRRSAQHLPRYFRTQVNQKFLASTLDQLLQPGVAEKLNGYFGRKTAKSFTAQDNYIGDISAQRENYQLEPAAVIKDELDNVLFYKDYNDYINQLTSFGADTADHSKLNSQEYYAWNPHIDWDKFTNYREYYWLPNGPQTITIRGEQVGIESEYNVTLADNVDNNAYLFTPDGLTQNPSLKLYRGVKYVFNINTEGLPFTIRTKRDLDDTFLLEDGVSEQNVEIGKVTLEFDSETPDLLYYVADNDINVAGIIKVANIEEATFLDVETDILGKKYYTTSAGTKLSNGMKIKFGGEVVPQSFATGEYYVEGVGTEIKLIPEANLDVASAFASDLLVTFDGQGFDRLPFDEAIGFPATKDYLVINRSSSDGNLWSRYNRWFHRSVIEEAARSNNQEIEIDQSQRAKRPIIEFDAGLKLYKFGTKVKKDVDLIDDYTKDVFSDIEGAQGYNVDNVDILDGMRILFVADPDPLVNGKIFQVKFINFADGTGRTTNRQISLVEVADTNPLENEVVLVKQGSYNKGLMFYYNGTSWIRAQTKTNVNQAPLFDIFDSAGNSYTDTSTYAASTFFGNKIFSYKQGKGAVDSELGFALSYRNIENVGDITFNFDLLTDSFNYQIENDLYYKNTDIGFLRIYKDRDVFQTVNGWQKGITLSSQPVVRQYVYDASLTSFNVDVYENSADLTDLYLRVFLNNKLQFQGKDYTVSTSPNNYLAITFVNELSIGDVINIKTRSSALKTENGFYELVSSMERNPANNNLKEFTLGEVNDHVATIVEEIDDFSGIYPGNSNLKDIGNLSAYGKRFVKHSAPLNLSLYHLLDKESNVLKSLRYARREYGKFKRLFLQKANELGYEGPVKQHVDKILYEINRDKIKSMPFYFSDMIPNGAAKQNNYEIEDSSQQFFALEEKFDLDTLSRKAVQVYLNGTQLIHGRDYTFNEDGFVIVTADKSAGDVLTVYEYESTNGSYVPPTPTKLGLYPSYIPQIFVDTTYVESQTVIQGHDGSKWIAFGDFRDELLLELEKRIFNNIKIKYDISMFDIHKYVGGEYRSTGFSAESINKSMLPDFVQWLQLIDDDYTDNNFFDRTNGFTFNYGSCTSPSGVALPGFWREVYKFAFDTDRPHTHPWEMLGFTIQPNWWEEQYGPAPYTRDNLVMWEDLEKGMIREPGKKFIVIQKYKRPGLTGFIPVDSEGNLLDPNSCGYARNFNSGTIKDLFVYGDGSPVESAWRTSSEYPFALLTSWLLNQPSYVFAVAFDRSRQKRNIANQIIYSETNNHITLDSIVFPNTSADVKQVYTSGLVNYVAGYMAADVTKPYGNYKENLGAVKTQIGFKVGGFTDKEKFRLILDSRTPLNQGNVFVPDENYKIFLNTSSPILTISYSGVIIERRATGFKISGYDNTSPSFKYFTPIPLENDPSINVGGISENYIEWASNQTYTQGTNVEFNGVYYRVTKNFQSGSSFEADNLAKLPRLPLIGGRDAVLRRTFFERSVAELPYGTVLKTSQEVVDFLLGYQRYLENLGFVFDYYEPENEVVSDWRTSAKEFLFWTTQNWAEGTVITLSPAAFQLKLKSEYSIVDNIFDTFYGYTLLKADGKKLVEEFTSLARTDANEFVLKPKSTADGIFSVKLPLVQKEHVVLLDNKTVFGDTIYDPEPGYRQERIKVLGYRSVDWDGSINIPGFVYDDAKVTDWEPWKDYSIGDTVKYKEFYYTASNKIAGAENFDNSFWNRLTEKPSPKLLPNFEYKTNQFADFYDLDSDNFDTEQQKLAQHLIGYQKRTYLENIINDDVSQYKFYQGFIQDKGSRNSLTKLFDALASDDKDSLEFYEEWAIKQGQYGVADGYTETEYLLDESKFRLTPQPIELVNSVTGQELDLIYRILPYEAYVKPKDYNHKPFPSKYVSQGYTKNSGFVNQEDIKVIVPNYDSILDISFSNLKKGEYIWVGNENQTWNVYQHRDTDLIVESVVGGTTDFTIVLPTTPKDYSVGEIIGVFDLVSTNLDPADSTYVASSQTTAAIGGFYKIKEVVLNKIVLETSDPVEDIEACRGQVSRLVSVRTSTLDTLNTLAQKIASKDDLFWIDNDNNGKWKVLKNTQGFNELQKISDPVDSAYTDFSASIAANKSNTVLAVGSPNSANGKVYIYRRGSNTNNFVFNQILEPDANECLPLQKFGSSVAISSDGKYLIVGSPAASGVKSKFAGTGVYDTATNYLPDDIVTYNQGLWKALVNIQGAVSSITFSSFDSVEQITNSIGNTGQGIEQVPMILTGNYPLESVTTDHILVRAPADMYEGSGVGDSVFLKWNSLTVANQEQTGFVSKEPFEGNIPGVNSTFITDSHVIQHKVDTILYVDSFTSKPVVNDVVETVDAFGTVIYVFEDNGRLVLYLNNVNGTFDLADSLFLANGEFVGEYTRVGPAESINTETQLGGYWYFNTSGTINIGTTTSDNAKGLIFQDVVRDGTPEQYYYNIKDYATNIFSSENTLNSYIRVLSYEGLPGPGGLNGEYLDNRYVIRAPYDLTQQLTAGSQFDFYMPTTQRYDGSGNDPTDLGLSFTDLNKRHTVTDLWDGYIFFQYTKFDTFGDPFEPRIGDIVRDVTTNATAEVTFYQRSGLNVTIFVKNVTGDWSQGDDYGDNAEIQFDGTPSDPSPTYQVDRVMGQIQYRSLGLPSEGIGKLIVLTYGTTLPVPTNPILLDNEYWFYSEDTVDGIARPANIPSVDNNDWQQTFNIPVTALGSSSGKTNEGMYTVYNAGTSTNFSKVSSYTVPERDNDLRLGSNVKITSQNLLTRAFIHAGGTREQTDETFPGRVYFVNFGEDSNGVTWEWDYAKDKLYKGEFSPTQSYKTNDLVYYSGYVYQAKTNLSANAFNLTDWTLIQEPLDYVGYVPNNTGLVADFGQGNLPIDQVGLINFGSNFDVSKNGEVLVTSARYTNDKPNLVAIYRSYNGNYQKTQTIVADNNTIDFGADVSISSDGMLLAISAPYDDDIKQDQGKVFVYKQQAGQFVLTQTLNSRNNEKTELFGTRIDFDGNILAVTAKNADASMPTTFDNDEMILDQDFTTFKKVYENAGVVYTYQRIDDTLIYSQPIDLIEDKLDADVLDNQDLYKFGQNLIVNEGHIYVGLPYLSVAADRTGAVIDYRMDPVKKLWTEHRTPKDTVDINKVKKLFLYDTKTNNLLTYLDYIDPIQGKIAGLAEQELSYKVYYDPATYSIGNSAVTVQPTNCWGPEHVGELWWDLTNAKFINPYQGNIIFSANNWNKLFQSNTIDVYEWVESIYTPAEWDALADTEQGITKGVSGQSRYGNAVYAEKYIYDSVSQTFSRKYYYWVKDKTTLPNVENRKTTAKVVADLITDPAAQGYKYVNFISDNSFIIHNCDSLIKGKDVAISAQFWTIDNQKNNIHNQYQLLTEGLESSKPSADIERKWFDSLVGKDEKGRPVPDPNLSPKERYGILNTPRQSWFVNNAEALKQFIERVNSVLIKNLIIDDKDLTPLLVSDPAPTSTTRLYDVKVDTVDDLDLVGVAKAQRAVFEPIIQNGKIVRINIVDPGRGYLVKPTYKIFGKGSGAVLDFTLNSVGAITDVEVLDQGSNYANDTQILVRRFTVLVEADQSIQGKWALYERISEQRSWNRIESQAFDVTAYWNYADWYATGYSEFTEIDYVIENSYELLGLDDVTGDVVKISNVGTGGWLLLEKIDNADSVDYTVNYKTIGRQNGTIQFAPTLYNTALSAVGFDTISYDTKFFDSQPTEELRVILNAIKNNLFTNDLAQEFNNLFFASLRYVFSEQTYVDWAFKTSFVKAKHNVGYLRQDITFNNDNLPSYEEYLKEVKPFKTKLREYLSDYDALDNSSSVISDFDLPPAYSSRFKKIIPQSVKIVDNAIIGVNADLQTYPNKHWLDNHTYKVVAVNVADGGMGYTYPPTITLEGGGGSGAEGIAYLGTGGAITKIVMTNHGGGYTSAPTVVINGSLSDDGVPAKLAAELGDGVVRNMHTIVKFDRVSGNFTYLDLNETESFAGSGNKYIFQLKYPMDLRVNTVEVLVNNNLSLRSEFTFENIIDKSKGYDRYFGRIIFTVPPINGASIVVNYRKSINLLEAADRVNLFYQPTQGQSANELGQVMDGIDYGGVEVKSFEFGGPQGWDTRPWYSDSWDTYDVSYEDEIITLDGSTISVELSKPFESGVVYNLYRNGVRLDDPNFGTGQPVSNPNAVCQSITGDGVSTTLELQELNIPTAADDVIIVRKTTSDGSFVADPELLDTAYSGGNLAYTTATGLLAEDINVDGDGFVTPTTSKGPEEVVPGQLLDSVDITVYERPTTGGSQIYVRNYIGNGTQETFVLGKSPVTTSALFVKVNNSIQKIDEDYTIDYDAKTVTFETAPAQNARVNLVLLDVSGTEILDIDTFTGDGSSNDIITNVKYNPDIGFLVSLNGQVIPCIITEAETPADKKGNAVINLAQPVQDGDVVTYALFDNNELTEDNFSQVTIDEIIADGSSIAYPLGQTPFAQDPSAWYTIVKVNDRILNPGYNQRFIISDTREYQLDVWQIPVGSLRSNQIEVFLNGRKLIYLQEWSFIGAGAFDPSLPPDQERGSVVTLSPGVGQIGDELRVFVLSDGEYRFGYYETDDTSTNAFVSTPGVLHLDNAYNENDVITVYQFSNNRSQDIERQNFDIVERTSLTIGTEGYYDLRHLRNGLIALREPAVDSQYVWISVNGVLLNANVDYVLTENRRYVKLLNPLNENDVLDIIHFSNVVLKNKFGWRQFKDMLNRTHYKRLDGTKNYKLAEDLYWYDRSIKLTDASDLPAPPDNARTPGIIWINKERIEYFKKEGNILKQIRRGTLGTGVATMHAQGTELYDQSSDSTMPYKDELVTNVFTADGTTNTYELDFDTDTFNLIKNSETKDLFEVFVAGKRLRKDELRSYQYKTDLRDTYAATGETIAQDSPEGDITLPAEFTVSGNVLTLLNAPSENTKVIVIRKLGKTWTDPGTPLSSADSDIARFLRATTVDLPR